MEEAKVEVSLPEGWGHDAGDSFSFHIRPEERVSGVRVHMRSAKETTLIEALNALAQTFDENASKADKGRGVKNRLIEVKEVLAGDGTKGIRATTGVVHHAKEGVKFYPACWHYLFQNSDGRIICVCVYNTARDEAFDPDAFILPKTRIK